MLRALHGAGALALLAPLGVGGPELWRGSDAPLHHPVIVDLTDGSRAATPARQPSGIRPELFGAVPNDGHNDYPALQRAIDVAAQHGVPVRLSADARYDSRHWLRLVNGSALIGAGSSSVIKFHWTKNDDRHDGYYVGNKDQLTGNRHITVAHLHILGAGRGKPAGLSAGNRLSNVPGIRMRLVHGLRIHHVEISRGPGISMLVQGSRGVRIRDNFVHNSGRDGINIGWFKRDSRRVLVEDNLIRRVGDDGIAIIGAPPRRHEPSGLQFRVLHNRILGWRIDPNGDQLGRGISVLGARRVLIRHTRIRNPNSAGILIGPSTRPDPWHHHARWRSKLVRVVHNNIGAIPTTGLLINEAVRIRWRANRFTDVTRTVAVSSCRLCTSS